ncbi:Zinc cluster transcription factor [Podosphaera aphanis]|nr:Zinc cluster transcription factor [Podosphaera aphanis]
MDSTFEPFQDHLSDNLPVAVASLPQESIPSYIFGAQTNTLNGRNTQSERLTYITFPTINFGVALGYPDDWLRSQGTQLHEMHGYHPSYMMHAPEVTTEYNILGDFLNNSLLDDGNLLSEDFGGLYSDPTTTLLPDNHSGASGPHTQENSVPVSSSEQLISRPRSTAPIDKTREYYFQAADPIGNDPPEERMQRLLQAKYNAGMLRPFNYTTGYSNLSSYLDKNVRPAQKLKILRQIEKIRPQFQQKVQALTDLELVYVEMWFEHCLMECDRVFASMAIPACCWRRTGEVFRGNREMAQLIHVPVEDLRDGKIALHEILADDSLVNYWEKFGAIAFDQSQKALITSCLLKSPGDKSENSMVKCCFSFIVRRDEHQIPALIIGNFLPQDPVKE